MSMLSFDSFLNKGEGEQSQATNFRGRAVRGERKVTADAIEDSKSSTLLVVDSQASTETRSREFSIRRRGGEKPRTVAVVYRRVSSLVDDEERNKRKTTETRTSGEKARDTHEIHYRYSFFSWRSTVEIPPVPYWYTSSPASAGCYITVVCLGCNEFIGHRSRVSCRTENRY